MTDKRRKAFESLFPTETDKRALQVNEQGYYVLMSTYNAWVNFQLGWEACEQAKESAL